MCVCVLGLFFYFYRAYFLKSPSKMPYFSRDEPCLVLKAFLSSFLTFPKVAPWAACVPYIEPFISSPWTILIYECYLCVQQLSRAVFNCKHGCKPCSKPSLLNSLLFYPYTQKFCDKNERGDKITCFIAAGAAPYFAREMWLFSKMNARFIVSKKDPNG